jgi:hypothetical protein
MKASVGARMVLSLCPLATRAKVERQGVRVMVDSELERILTLTNEPIEDAERQREVMTPESPRWDEFADALYEALEFTEHSSGDPGKTSWKCDGRAAKSSHGKARAVMRRMGGVDVRPIQQ